MMLLLQLSALLIAIAADSVPTSTRRDPTLFASTSSDQHFLNASSDHLPENPAKFSQQIDFAPEADSVPTSTPRDPTLFASTASDQHFLNASSDHLPENPANFSGKLHPSNMTSGLGIIGGRVADISQHPYIVSAVRDSKTYCSASIISARYALTTAFCSLYFKINSQSVFSGSSIRGSGTAHTITDVIIHEDFNLGQLSYNIALLRVDPPFDESRVIELSRSPSDTAAGKWGVVSGWGMNVRYNLTYQLHEIDMQVMDDAKCRSMMEAPNYGEFCAGDLGTGKALCTGDSGDPFVVTNAAGKRVLAGFEAWRVLACEGTRPDVYIKVHEFVSWIERNVKN